MGHTRQRARTSRWTTAVEVLAEVRRSPGLTRAQLAHRLGLSSGSATEVAARLRDARLLGEDPAPTQGRGRPTTVLRAHEHGPLVVAVDLRHRDWRCVTAGIDGSWDLVRQGRHEGQARQALLEEIRAAVALARSRFGDRVRVVSASVPGVVTGTVLRQAPPLGWADVDLAPIADADADADADDAARSAALLAGNDATLSAVAEARTGSARDTRVALSVLVAGGTGGALVIDGRPFQGATGAAGEFGHLPIGRTSRRCSCGAYGCWDLTMGANALARALGDPPPTDPVAYTRATARQRLHRPAVQHALDANAAALGAGIAGLVNALDPGVVTLAGLATEFRAAAPDAFRAAYASGLMAVHATAAPPVLDSTLGDDAALIGAIAVGLDAILDETGIADWVASLGGRGS